MSDPDPDPARWRLMRELFTHLVDKSPSQRSRHLELACEGDPDLRRDVEALLGEHDGFDALPVESLAPLSNPATALAATVDRVGDYRLFERLGWGGAGSVFRAEHPLLGEVALKLQPAAALSASVTRRRFEQEAAALRAIRHPVLCTLHDAFVTTDHAVLVMELVHGESLASRLVRGTLGWREARAIVAALADALAATHARGIVHRDLKPTNVMLEPGGRVRLIDFGIAKFDDVRLTLTGHLLGSPRYMSPEQWSGGTIDARADQYSLALLWYESLSGRLPFDPDDDEQSGAVVSDLLAIAERTLHGAPRALPEYSHDGVALASTNTVIMRMLARRRDDRFASLSAVCDAIETLSLRSSDSERTIGR